MSDLLLPSLLCPPPAFYRAIALHRPADGAIAVCSAARFDKRQKAAHRFAIADARGRLELTVPVEKPYGKTWADTRVSLHGRWWEIMATALESAYGRTPYFEFYADDFLPLIADPDRFTTVGALNADFDRAIRRALALDDRTVIYDDPGACRPAPLSDWQPEPYWQVRASTLGFIPGLSVLDMIFNLGPEALLMLSAPTPTAKRN